MFDEVFGGNEESWWKINRPVGTPHDKKMHYKVTKEFKFDCAHYLTGAYSGQCENIHGHTYKLLVTLASDKLNEEGMVIDFGELKEIVEPMVDMFDHSIVINKDAGDAELVDTLKGKTKVVEFPANPTAENMCRFFYLEIEKNLMDRFTFVERVRVYETPTSYAEYTEVQ